MTLTLEATPPASTTNVAGYEFRYGSTWAGSIYLGKSATPRFTCVSPGVDGRAVTFRVKSYSAAGVRSIAEATVSVTPVVVPGTYSLAQQVSDTTTYPGTKTNTVVSSSHLVLDGSNLTGTYEASHLTTDAARATWSVQTDLDTTAMTWDEAVITWDDATFTWTGAYLYEVVDRWVKNPTWDQAGFTWDGTYASVSTWDGAPDLVPALAATLAQDFNAAATWPVLTPTEVSEFTDAGLKVSMRRPHSRFVPRITLLQGKSYDLDRFGQLVIPSVGTSMALPGVSLKGQLSQRPTASRCYYQPIYVQRTITVTAIRVNINSAGTAGATIRVAIYHSSATGQPGALISDIGTLSVDSTGQKQITGLTIELLPGHYSIMMATDASATQAQHVAYRGYMADGWCGIGVTNWQFWYEQYVSKAYGVAADPGTAWTNNGTSADTFVYYTMLTWTN